MICVETTDRSVNRIKVRILVVTAEFWSSWPTGERASQSLQDKLIKAKKCPQPRNTSLSPQLLQDVTTITVCFTSFFFGVVVTESPWLLVLFASAWAIQWLSMRSHACQVTYSLISIEINKSQCIYLTNPARQWYQCVALRGLGDLSERGHSTHIEHYHVPCSIT